MEAQLKGAVLIALVVVPQWRCPILKPLSAKLPPKSETAPHPGWQDGTILQPGHHGRDGYHDRENNHGRGQTGQTGQKGQKGQTRKTAQTKLTLKLDFPGNLCRAAFAILSMFFVRHN